MIKTIEDIIEKHLQYWATLGLNKLPLKEMEDEMRDKDQDPNEEWKIWQPIKSKVSAADITKIEKSIGHTLPAQYISYLKYKHFYELYICEARFIHPVNIWYRELETLIFEGYPRELLLDKGYIPFATWGDWGMLCFDTNKNSDDNNYPVVLWDHDDYLHYYDKYADFNDMMRQLDNEFDLEQLNNIRPVVK